MPRQVFRMDWALGVIALIGLGLPLLSIQQGLDKQAINQLNALINQVQVAVKNGKSADSGATLIAAANALIASLS